MCNLEEGKCYIIQHSDKTFLPEDVGKPVKIEMINIGGNYCIFGRVDGFTYKTAKIERYRGLGALDCFGDNPVEYIQEQAPKPEVKTVSCGVEVTHGDEVFSICVDQKYVELGSRYVYDETGDSAMIPVELLDVVIDQLQKLREEVLSK